MARSECGFTLDDVTCAAAGDHLCGPRAARVRAFFSEILVHTKGVYARRRFVLALWQAEELITPVFGEVVWDDEWGCYRRKHRIVWIELARKQGKSEILAGIALYLLCADDEEGAEIYGAAKDRDQARKVFDVAKRMVELSPVLSSRLSIYNSSKRIVDDKTASWYEVVAADAGGNLGHNPHGVVFDEALTQPNGDLWDALRTGMGTRVQPLLIAATTPGDDVGSWCGRMHDGMVKNAADPDREPHVYVYLRNTPDDADPFDEANWVHANPALGDFLSISVLRDEAREARNDPSKENSFRQYRLAQWVRQSVRWMPMHLWDGCSGELWPSPDWGARWLDEHRLDRTAAYFGLDLAAKFDLTAWAVLLQDEGGDFHAWWRFWLPEAGLAVLDKGHNGGWSRWAVDGWLTVTEGNVVDYTRIYDDIEADAERFLLVGGDADQWSMAPVIQEISRRTGVEEIDAYPNTFARMTPGMNEVMAMVRSGRLQHHGNPIARHCFDAAEVARAPYDPELIRPIKPERQPGQSRVDAVPALAMAAAAWRRQQMGDNDEGGWVVGV
jgi:phage terminase large subunit-like protein